MISILNASYCLLNEIIPELPERVELDLGCGRGGFALKLAESRPDMLLLAADVMYGRLRKIERKRERRKLENLRLLRVEARHLLSIILPDRCLDRVHILCPDPWPKHKHKGNRLLSSDFMAQIYRVLKKDGILHFATDDPRYMEAVRTNIETSGLFDPASPDVLADVRGFKTEFELDWLAIGRVVPHVAYRRKENVARGPGH